MRAKHPTSLRILRNVNNLSLNYSHSIASILIFNEFLLQPYECSCYPQSQMVTANHNDFDIVDITISQDYNYMNCNRA